MQLTDDEIREILIERKKRKKKKKRKRKRVFMALLLVFVLFLAIGIFINRGALISSKGIIFIDPGHGGMDSGSTVGKRYESNDTLALSLLVKDELESLGYKVYMSRTSDEYVDRAERGEMANEKNAQLMVSIHRNKAEEGSGVEVYIPSSASDEAQLLGNNIMKALVEQGFTERQVRPGTLNDSNDDYEENRVPNMPSCLVEVGFMQDKHDNKIFDDNQDALAKAIATAIDRSFVNVYGEKE